ncbi:MAG: HD domain-containing protein [Chloroflexota bacterium]
MALAKTGDLVPVLSRLERFLAKEGLTVYLVGGFVRDLLLSRQTKDIDIAIAGDAFQVGQKLAQAWEGHFVPLDEARGMARIIIPEEGLSIDMVSLRGEVEQDLRSRDFTVDAMAIKLGEEEVIDPLNGRADLKRGLIRLSSESALVEDPLRLLRAVRLASELGFTIEAETEKLLQKHSDLIAGMAGERLREELMRILSRPGTYDWFRFLDKVGLLGSLFPELSAAKGVQQPPEHFWNVFDHSLETVRAVESLLQEGSWGEAVSLAPWSPQLAEYFHEDVSSFPRKALVKLAALLHDVAKPQTRTVEESGKMRFLGHAQEGAATARGIMERLRFSQREIKFVDSLIYHHLRPAQMGDGGLPTPRAIYRFFRDTQEAAIASLFLSLADHLAARGPQLIEESWRGHIQQTQYILDEYLHRQQEVKPPKILDGHDLIRIFELKPGPVVGQLLDVVKEAQAAGEVSSREEALDLVKRQLGQ